MKKTLFQSLAVIAIVLVLSSWGSKGHKSINSHVTFFFNDALSQFDSWSSTLASHASDADNRKSSDPNEAPKHYIDIENYTEFNNSGVLPNTLAQAIAEYSSANVYDWGILPWATKTTYDTLVSCFRRGDLDKAVLTAADMGHYVGDGHMPLHITSNYNGQLSGNYGIHSRYESDMVDAHIYDFNYTAESISLIPDVQQYILNYIYDSHTYIDTVLKSDNYAKALDSSYGDVYIAAMWAKLGNITNHLFEESAHSIAELIYTAYNESQSTTGINDVVTTTGISLEQNFPNPFSDITKIQYSLAQTANVQVFVLDTQGKAIATLANGQKSAGVYTVDFMPTTLSAGVYFLVLKSNNYVETKRMVLIK
ncbi:MAG TPA: T9SS type A sorting domain-containing protein [Williamwhitmania sp.]|nr:T9SS type A sorting domain-containing protein [Williamwhitmania sp.]